MASDSQDLSAFITALLSHDISNYNQTSRGYLEMMQAEQMGELTAQQARALGICLRQTGRIQSLIDSVRLVVELAGRPLAPADVDLDEAIRKAVARVQNEYADREVRVRYQGAERLVRAEDLLIWVPYHLISNAVRHNECEIVEVEIDVEPEEGQTHWKVRVRDNGEGIPPGRAESLFGRLSERQVHGSGFGLALTHALVTRWGGRVWLEETRPSEGTTVAFTLPRGHGG